MADLATHRKIREGSHATELAQAPIAATLEHGRVYINPDQYFEGVEPAVWEFQIGGYQVCEKWLKDRRGRTLGYDDLMHYPCIVEALRETIDVMQRIGAVADEAEACRPVDSKGAANGDAKR